jgi:hypothetical protein
MSRTQCDAVHWYGMMTEWSNAFDEIYNVKSKEI